MAADADVAEAEAAIKRLATAPADEGVVTREIWLLRLQLCQASEVAQRAQLGRCSPNSASIVHQPCE